MKKYLYYTPLYWPIWLLIFTFWLSTKLPYRTQLTLGKYLGLLVMRLAKKSKRVTAINLKICFPNLTDNERAQLLRESFINIGIAVFETALGFWGSEKKLRPLAHIHGYEHVDKAIAEGKGVLLLGAHYTTIEIVGRLCTLDNKLSVMYRSNKIGFVDYLLKRNLGRHYDQAIPSTNIRAMVSLLQSAKAVWYSADVSTKRKSSVFAPFFGIATSTSKAVTRFTKMSDCVVIPTKNFRRADGTGYDITLYPPLENFPTASEEEDALIINQWIEKAVRENPAQYLWQYKRFKTRPIGEPRIY